MALTDKQKRFVQEYLKDCNATQAAIRAGYSEDNAGAIGHENLKKLEIKEALTEAKKQLAEAAQIEAEWVIKNLKEIALRSMEHGRSFNPSAATQAFKTLNDMLGLEAPKKLDITATAKLIRDNIPNGK